MRFHYPAVFWCLVAAISPASAQELVERATFNGRTFQVTATALSPDGKMLAFGGGDPAKSRRLPGGETSGGELKLWDTTTGKETASLPGYTGSNALVFSPDGKTLASAGPSVQVWDVTARRQIHRFGGRNHDWVKSLAFSQDGKKLASTSELETMVWDVGTGKELTSWKRQNYSYGAMALSRDLATLAKGDYQEIDLCNIASGKVIGTLSEHRGEVGFLSYSEDGKTLVAAGTWFSDHNFKYQGDLKLWDVASRSERVSFKGPFGKIHQAVLSSDGKTLALLDSPELRVIPDIKLIDVATGRQTLIRKLPTHSFTTLTFTRDGRLFVLGTGNENSFRLWQVLLRKKE